MHPLVSPELVTAEIDERHREAACARRARVAPRLAEVSPDNGGTWWALWSRRTGTATLRIIQRGRLAARAAPARRHVTTSTKRW